MNKEKFLNSGLLEQYVLGLTTPEEELLVEQYAQAFPEIKEELSQLKQAMDNYVTEHIAPRPGNKNTSTENSFSLTGNRPAQARLSWSLLFAIVFAGLAFYLFQLEEDKKQDVTQLEAEYAALENYYDHKDDASQLSLLSKIQDPRTLAVVVNGIASNPSTFAVYHWNTTTTQSWLETTKLPGLDSGSFYHIFGRTKSDYTHLGIIDSHSHRLIELPYLAGIKEIIISLSPSDSPNTALDQEQIMLRTSIEP